MPVIPSFGSFAQTPNLAQSFLGGQRAALDRDQLVASITSQQRQFQLEQQKLAQDAQQAEMAFAAKEKSESMQQLRAQQEMEIQKAYQNAQLGLKQRELEQQQQEFQLKATQAARQFQARQQYEQFLAQNPGKEQEAIYRFGPGMSAPSGAYSASRTSAGLPAGAEPVPGLPESYKQFQTGPASRQLVNIPTGTDTDMTARPVPGAEGQYQTIGKRVYAVRETEEAKATKKALSDFEKSNEFKYAERYLTGETPLPKDEQVRAKVQQVIAKYTALKSAGTNIARATIPKGVSTTGGKRESMVSRANELAKEHPGWSRDKILNTVREEFK